MCEKRKEAKLRTKALKMHQINDEDQTPFSNIMKTFMDTKAKDFCFSLFNGTLYANKEKYRLRYGESQHWNWRQEEIQTIEYILWECQTTKRIIQLLLRERPGNRGQEKIVPKGRHGEYFFSCSINIYVENIKGHPISKEATTAQINDYIASSFIHTDCTSLPLCLYDLVDLH